MNNVTIILRGNKDLIIQNELVNIINYWKGSNVINVSINFAICFPYLSPSLFYCDINSSQVSPLLFLILLLALAFSYLPANIDAISKLMTILFLIDSGTSPLRILSARPSAIAVLPT